jgi:hypothetical protein
MATIGQGGQPQVPRETAPVTAAPLQSNPDINASRAEVISPETGQTAGQINTADQFDDGAVQGRAINRNDVMRAAKNGDGAAPAQSGDGVASDPISNANKWYLEGSGGNPDPISGANSWYWNGEQYPMSPSQAYTGVNQFANRATQQHFTEQGVHNPAPMEVVDMNAQVRSDVLDYAAYQRGEYVPNGAQAAQNMEVYSGLAGRHAMIEAGMDPYADPYTADQFAVQQHQNVSVAGDTLYGYGYNGIGFDFNR